MDNLYMNAIYMLGFLGGFDQIAGVLGITLQVATVLIITSIAGMLCERSGVVDIGLEGKLLLSAFASALTSYYVTEKLGWQYGALAGLAMGMIAGVLASSAHAYACVSRGGDQVVSGVAINFFAAGFTIVVTNALFGTGDTPPLRQAGSYFSKVTLPGIETIGEIPVIGTIYVKVLSGQNALTWLALLLVPLIWLLFYRTRFGLRVRAVGENPQAVDTAGISVASLRYRSVILGGAICGIAGTFLALGASNQFSRDMSAGKGYIALVVLILGKWRPVPTFLGCLLFAFLQASSDAWLPQELPVLRNISAITNMAPYILVLLIMLFVGKSSAPAAVGVPYKKER